MSLILCLEADNGQEVPVQVQPDDDFQTFLSRAKDCVGKDVDITTIVGDAYVSPTDSIYQFMLRAAFSDGTDNAPSIAHEIIDLSDQNILIEQSHFDDDGIIVEEGVDEIQTDNKNCSPTTINDEIKILNVEFTKKRTTEPRSYNNALQSKEIKSRNTCCFCKGFINLKTFPSYIFDEKDQKELKKSKHRRNKGLAKVVCDSCLRNDFEKLKEMPKNFENDVYLTVRNNEQHFYKRKHFDKHRNVTILNSLMKNVSKTCQDVEEIESPNISYSCRLCNAVLDTLPIEHCLDHVSSRAVGLVFPCALCEYGYSSFDELKVHINTTHAEKQSTPKTSSLESKQVASSRVKRKSEIGLKLLNHLLIRQQEKKSELEWLDEGTGVMRKDSLLNDENTSINEELTTKESESDSESGIWIIEANEDSTLTGKCEEVENCEQYQCDTCSEYFDSMESCSSHVCQADSNDAISALILKERILNVSLENNKARVIAVKSNVGEEVRINEIGKTSIEGQHKCQMCSKSFHTKLRLQFHIRYIHNAGSDPSTLRCSACPELIFKNEGMLYDHMHFTHPRNKKYQCSVEGCNKQFTIRGALKNHLISHKGERRHACNVCNKHFFDKQTLNEHKVTHLKVKPFQCHICHKYLNRKSRLRMHVLNHQAQSSCSPILACKRCNAAFSDAITAQHHLNELGLCSSHINWESWDSQDIKAEESVDDPDVAVNVDQRSPQDMGSCELFEDISDRRFENDHIQFNKESRLDGDSLRMSEEKTEEYDIINELSDDARKSIIVVDVDKVFRCEFCESVYWKQEALNFHREEHKGRDNPYICHICGAQFSSYSRCITHKTTHGFHRTSSSKPSSNSCENEAAKNQFPVVKHFSCEVCNKSYLHWTYLQVHRKSKHSDNVHMYKCLTCGDEFPNSWGVAYHRKRVHGQSSGSAPPDEVPDANIERVQYSCPDCGIILSTKAQLFLHKRSSHPTPPSPPKADMFACSVCNKRYITKAGLHGHFKKQHEKSNPNQTHRCLECNKIFINASGLNTHIRRVHMKEIKFKCTECEMGFYSLCDLQSHKRRHSGERPFPCHLCGRYFRTKGMRNQHVRIHSGERPYKCDLCGVGFRRSYALRSHRFTHAPHTRSLHCPICPRMFRLKAEFNTHLRHTHFVDPSSYPIPQKQEVSSKQQYKTNPIRSNAVHDQQNREILIINTEIEDNLNKNQTTHQNANIDPCLFTTIFDGHNTAFINNIEEVHIADSVIDEELIHSDEHLIQPAHQLVVQDENSSNNLCVISGESLVNGEIILDANNQYILSDNDQIIGELSQDSKNMKLITLNNATDQIKFITMDSDLVSNQVEEFPNDLYESNLVIDKVVINADTSMDDDAMDEGSAFIIDQQETEGSNDEKSTDDCKYFSVE